MTVLRELVARLGFQVDGQGFKQAESRIERLRGGLQRLGQFAAGVGVGALAKKIVDLGSDAQETRNVLEQVFGAGGAEQVAQWAQRVGGEVGRSRFELMEFSATMGAMLEPMLGNAQAAQTMSTSIAQLAVDLGSFFNTTDKEALTALRAGLAGESEPLRRYGVVLLDATLQEFAHARGIRKKVQAMNVAEKTDLRYQFILANTTKAQGDAARTSEGYANASKALRGALRDLGTEMGMAALPAVQRFVRWARDAVSTFRDWARGSYILQSAMLVLGALAVALGISLAVPFLLAGIAVGALVLLIDDLHALFTGGTSVVGSYIDAIFGLGAADAFVENHRAGVELLHGQWLDLLDTMLELEHLAPDLQGVWEIMLAEGATWADYLAGQFQRLVGWVVDLDHKLYELFKGAAEMVGVKLARPDYLPPMARTAERGTNARLLSEDERRERFRSDLDRGIHGGIGARRQSRRDARDSSFDTPAGETVRFGHARRRVSVPRGHETPAAVPNQVNVAGSSVTINGGNLAEVRRVVQEVLASERRKTVAALGG